MKNTGRRGMEGGTWEDLTVDCLVFILYKLGLEDLTLGVSLHEYHVNAFSFNSLLKFYSTKSHGYATKLSSPSISGSPLFPDLVLASIGDGWRFGSAWVTESLPQFSYAKDLAQGRW
ncbi:hypothetical protein KSP40_PGU011558 [Platanthera guangdongensis]|uniref:Uncharacterized protein n=1 Tax=Platanthera guangdongensis TaxID=2320717 RepID=A0ABR2LV28_9ASPA